MPRVFGLNLVAVLLSALAFWVIGVLFYAFIFAETWPALWGFSEAELAAQEARFAVTMGLGALLTLAMAFILGFALKMAGADDMMSALKTAAFLWAGFAVTTNAYDTIYAGQPVALLAIDSLHQLFGFLAMAAIQRAFK